MPVEKDDGDNGDSRMDEAKKSGHDSSSDEESSMDGDESEDRRAEIIDDLNHIEKQFAELKEQLYRLRVKHADEQLEQVQKETSPEYLQQVQELEAQLQRRHLVGEKLREFRLQSIKNKCECELQAARQHLESERQALLDSMMADLQDKLQRAKEDRQNLEFSEGLLNDRRPQKRPRKNEFSGPDKRRKPVTVSGPVIIYMLPEMDIIEDWATIRRARLRVQASPDEKNNKTNSQSNMANHSVVVRCEDGKLCYQGNWFLRGSKVVVENKTDGPQMATITAINSGEVCIRRQDGTKTKLYCSQLQRGRYSIRFQE